MKTKFSGKEIIAFCVAVDEMQGFKYLKSHEAGADNKSNFNMMLELIKSGDFTPTDDHYTTANSIIEYFEGLVFKAIQRPLSDFEQKIMQLIKAEDINVSGTDKRLPIAPSLPSVYRNNMSHDEWADTERSLRKVSDYVGTIRERIETKGVVGMVRYMSKTNSLLVAVIHDNKHIIKFFYDLSRSDDAKQILNKGAEVKFSALVKKHEISKFSRCKETFVNRVSLLV